MFCFSAQKHAHKCLQLNHPTRRQCDKKQPEVPAAYERSAKAWPGDTVRTRRTRGRRPEEGGGGQGDRATVRGARPGQHLTAVATGGGFRGILYAAQGPRG